jgi:hypothetical protein
METMTRSEAEAHLRRKVLFDKSFRNWLLANPREALEKEFNQSLPPDIEIEVHEESPSKIHIVIPTVEHHELDESGNLRRRQIEFAPGAARATSASGCTLIGCSCSTPPPTYSC